MAAKTKKSTPSSSTDVLFPGMRTPPKDVVHEEGVLTAWDGTDLFWQCWIPSSEPRGVVALMHGFGEHSTRYHHVASTFVRAGFAVGAIDARGHGRSAGPRGHVGRFAEYPRDMDLLVGRLEERWTGLPVFGFGHSNGGLIALHHALMAPGRLDAYAVTSPFCGFEVKVPVAKRAAAVVMTRVYPRFVEATDLDPAILTHDKAVVEQYAADPLVGRVATSRWYTETKDAQAELLDEASRIRAPFLFLVAGDDHVVDAKATERVYHRLGSPDREFELLPGLYHEVLNEEGWESLMARIVAWYERFGAGD